MQYEIRRPNSEAEAIEIIVNCLRVIYDQIEVHRGVKRKAWNGDYVDHCRVEANHALAWLAYCYPKHLARPEPLPHVGGTIIAHGVPDGEDGRCNEALGGLELPSGASTGGLVKAPAK